LKKKPILSMWLAEKVDLLFGVCFENWCQIKPEDVRTAKSFKLTKGIIYDSE
jgi:hypothetical protein